MHSAINLIFIVILFISTILVLRIGYISYKKKQLIAKTLIAGSAINHAIPMLIILAILNKDYSIIDMAFFYAFFSFIVVVFLAIYYQEKQKIKTFNNNDTAPSKSLKK